MLKGASIITHSMVAILTMKTGLTVRSRDFFLMSGEVIAVTSRIGVTREQICPDCGGAIGHTDKKSFDCKLCHVCGKAYAGDMCHYCHFKKAEANRKVNEVLKKMGYPTIDFEELESRLAKNKGGEK